MLLVNCFRFLHKCTTFEAYSEDSYKISDNMLCAFFYLINYEYHQP